MNKPYLLRANVELEVLRSQASRHYTAKLAKRILLAGDPGLEPLFAPARGARPKLVHITPLYIERDGKTRTATYTDKLETGYYSFYLGSLEEELDPYRAMAALEATPETITFGKAAYRLARITIETIDPAQRAEHALQRLQREGRMKLILASPTVLRDPLVSTKYKTLVPSIMNLFSVPVYVRLYLLGQLRRSRLLRLLLKLHRALTVPPTLWETLRKLDLHYEPGRRVPTLIGYLNIHYNPENDPNDEALQILNEILPLTLALGTGVGRAAGLGHITIS